MPIHKEAVPVPRWENYVSRGLLASDRFYFVHVGANCGPSNCSGNRREDPIWDYQRRYRWHGAAVEANPHTFSVLQSNYAATNANVQTINIAVTGVRDSSGDDPDERVANGSSATGRQISFWCPRHPRNLRYSEGCTTSPEWGRQSAFGLPLSERHLALHTTVAAISLKALWHRLGPPAHVDLLVVDVEGAEDEVLSGGQLPKPYPALLLFETSCFTNVECKRNGTALLGALRARLQAQGYVPLKLGDGPMHDGWSKSRTPGANWKDDVWMRNSSRLAHVLPVEPPRMGEAVRRGDRKAADGGRLAFDPKLKAFNATALDAVPLTSGDCAPPRCRWHSRFLSEWDGRDWLRTYAPTVCVCTRAHASESSS